MERTALLTLLSTSEKSQAMVAIRTTRAQAPVVGAVQKVLNQVVLIRTRSAESVMLTCADIVSVTGISSRSPLQWLSNALRRWFRLRLSVHRVQSER